MRLHRFIPLALLAAVLSGCARTTEDPLIVPIPATIAGTTAETIAETIPETTTETGLSFELKGDGIAFSLDGNYFQTIAMEHVPDADAVSVCDYDSDGFEDVFIPDFPNDFRGHYYRYEGRQLVLWDAMNFEEGGTGWFMTKNPDGTLLMDADNIDGNFRTTYCWEEDALVPVELVETYWKGGNTIKDTYRYSDTQEKILCQREIRETYGNQSTIIEYPLYFRISSDTVQVMRNTDIVQEIPLGSRFWDSYAELAAFYEREKESPTVPLDGGYLHEPQCYLGTDDYDFDGYEDLYVPDTLMGNRTGMYYRYEPESGEFIPWDALNAIGYDMYVDAEERTLNAFMGIEGERKLHSFRWEDGVLAEIPTE